MDLRTCALEIIQNLLETERGPILVMLNGAFTPGPAQRLKYYSKAPDDPGPNAPANQKGGPE